MPERPNPYRGHRFPADVIVHAVRICLRFAASFGGFEELLEERGVAMSYETVRRWVAKFGAQYADELRCRRPHTSRIWRVDDMAVRVGGPLHWLWRAVDENGEPFDVFPQAQRDTVAAAPFAGALSQGVT